MRCPIKFWCEQAERFATSIKCAERLLQTLCTLARTSGVKDDSAIVYHFIRLHIRHTCVIGSLMALVTTVLCEPIGLPAEREACMRVERVGERSRRAQEKRREGEREAFGARTEYFAKSCASLRCSRGRACPWGARGSARVARPRRALGSSARRAIAHSPREPPEAVAARLGASRATSRPCACWL